jgi:hypothetical protein
MLVLLYLDFGRQSMLLGHSAMAGNTKSKEFHVALPRRPKRVLLNAESDVLASEMVVNEK